MIKLAVDAMGSDLGPSVIVSACLRFMNDYDVHLSVYGKKEALTLLENQKNIVIMDAREVMEMNDGALATRRKKQASMIRAIDDCVANLNDGIVSAGSTGALLSASTLIIKTIKGIDRPALLGSMPTINNQLVDFLDMGASAENTGEHLVQYAKLGNAYAKYIRNIKAPKVALLNIGGEESKGDTLRKETFKLLQACPDFNFVGNVEGRELFDGHVDIVVTDGFSGNITLKTIEGTASLVNAYLKDSLMSSLSGKIGAMFAKKALKQMKSRLDYKKYGGALLTGLNKPIVKAHGSSDEEAFYYALVQLYKMVDNGVVEKIAREINHENL